MTRSSCSTTHDEARRIGGPRLRRESWCALETTALDYDAFLNLAIGSRIEATNEQHSYATAARTRRQSAVDEVRARGRQKQRRRRDE